MFKMMNFVFKIMNFDRTVAATALASPPLWRAIRMKLSCNSPPRWSCSRPMPGRCTTARRRTCGDAVCFGYTCRRLIDLSLSDCRYRALGRWKQAEADAKRAGKLDPEGDGAF